MVIFNLFINIGIVSALPFSQQACFGQAFNFKEYEKLPPGYAQ
jgi:hypothetical protein